MTKRNVMISILTSRMELGLSPFDVEEEEGEEEQFPDFSGKMPDPDELLVEGKLVTNPNRVELIYEENEGSGMAGSITSIGFDRSAPELITVSRTGTVFTSMSFEEGKRHISVFDTPFSSFQICIRTLHVDNRLLTDGNLFLEYLVEVHGAEAEHCRMTVTLREATALFDSAP